MSAVSTNTIPEEVLREVLKLAEAQKTIDLRAQAQNHFLPFVHHVYDNFIEGRHHRIFAEKMEAVSRGELKRIIINLPPRHALEVSEKVLTTRGWRTIETLAPGDFVLGPDGEPTEVLGKSDRFEDRELFEVQTDDGCSVVCDSEHRWTVRLCRKYKLWVEYTAEELFQREQGALVKKLRSGKTMVKPGAGSANPRAAMLPPFQAAQLSKKKLPVDPYVLGVWLGDGAALQSTFTASDKDAGIIRNEFERRGYVTRDRGTAQTFGVDSLKVVLRDALGVLGNKHIPEEYLLGSEDQRRDLLKGLMDSDGNISKQGQCFFSQKDPALTHQVRRLLWSLGIKNSLQTSTAKIGDREYGTCHRVSFYGRDVANLPRKEERTIGSDKGRFVRVRKLPGRGTTQCITVAREDGLFLVGEGMVVTHNSKSEFASYLMPAWFIGRNPHLKIIQATHNMELATRFGRKTRDLINDPRYQEIFPNTHLKEDSQAAGRWETTDSGEYFAAGVGSTVTGRGADLFIIDDPHSEQDALSSDTAFPAAYEWYTSGPRQRLQPGATIIVVMTRWGKKDLTGRLLQAQSSDPLADQWEVIEFPAILPSGSPLWPEFWDKASLLGIKASLPVAKWQAQWQQQPESSEAAIIKREWWQDWDKDSVPNIQYVLQSYDTAFSAKETADFSAITTWGVFTPEPGEPPHLILLDAQRGRWGFPELREVAQAENSYWKPDMIIIEARGSGQPLADELRRSDLPVVTFAPSRRKGGGGMDKRTRMHMVSPLFEGGRVWAPLHKKFAEEVIEEVSTFGTSDHDDYCDSMTMALIRFRQGGFVILDGEEDEEEMYETRKHRRYY